VTQSNHEGMLLASRGKEAPTAVLDTAGAPLIKGRSYMLGKKKVTISDGRQREGNLDHFYEIFAFDESDEEHRDNVEASYPEGRLGPAEYHSEFEPVKD